MPDAPASPPSPAAAPAPDERHRDGYWCKNLRCTRCYKASTWQESERDEALRWMKREQDARIAAEDVARTLQGELEEMREAGERVLALARRDSARKDTPTLREIIRVTHEALQQ